MVVLLIRLPITLVRPALISRPSNPIEVTHGNTRDAERRCSARLRGYGGVEDVPFVPITADALAPLATNPHRVIRDEDGKSA